MSPKMRDNASNFIKETVQARQEEMVQMEKEAEVVFQHLLDSQNVIKQRAQECLQVGKRFAGQRDHIQQALQGNN